MPTRPVRAAAAMLALAGALIGSAPAAADPKVRETTTLYELAGTTAEAVRADLRVKGPAGRDGRRFVGYTSTYVRYRFDFAADAGVCRVTSITTEVDVAFTMPTWKDRDRAEPALQQKWDTFIAALWLHERGHRDIGVEIAREIERELSGLGQIATNGCGDPFRDLALARANRILDDLQPRHDRYDRETQHGRTQGAGVLLE